MDYYNNLLQAIKTKQKLLIYLILLLGILLRAYLLIDNRNLLIDEANVARNIHERDYLALFKPLSYEQYAPLLFLWMSKSISLMVNASEMSLRLFPFLCGSFSLILFYYFLKKIIAHQYLFYPIILMAFSPLMIRYSTEFKQYSSDVLVALLLLHWALYRIQNFDKTKSLFLKYSLIALVAFALSMPAVFMLAMLGVLEFYLALKHKQFKYLKLFCWAQSLVLIYFLCYYQFNLSLAIHSNYLTGSHSIHLFQFPIFKSQAIAHNLSVLYNFWAPISGQWALSIGFTLLLFSIGLIHLYSCNRALWIAIVAPILFLLLAVLLGQFTLMPRVCLFIYPLLYTLCAFGWIRLYRFTKNKISKVLVIGLSLYQVIMMSNINSWFQPLIIEEPLKAFAWAKEQQQDAATTIWIHQALYPAAVYYSTIHPNKKYWNFLQAAKTLSWQVKIQQQELGYLQGQHIAIYPWNHLSEIIEEKKFFNERHYNIKNEYSGQKSHAYLIESLKSFD